MSWWVEESRVMRVADKGERNYDFHRRFEVLALASPLSSFFPLP